MKLLGPLVRFAKDGRPNPDLDKAMGVTPPVASKVNPGPVNPGPVRPGPVNPGPVNPGPVNPTQPIDPNAATRPAGKGQARPYQPANPMVTLPDRLGKVEPDPFHQAYQARYGTQPPPAFNPVAVNADEQDFQNEQNALYRGPQARPGPRMPQPSPGQAKPAKPSLRSVKARQMRPVKKTGFEDFIGSAIHGAKTIAAGPFGQAFKTVRKAVAGDQPSVEKVASFANRITGQPYEGKPGWLANMTKHLSALGERVVKPLRQLGDSVDTANRPALGSVPEAARMPSKPKPMPSAVVDPRRGLNKSWGLKRVGTVRRYSSADESSFLRMLEEEPKNPIAHLVYADWLEEQGDRDDEVLAHKWLGGFFGHHPHVAKKPGVPEVTYHDQTYPANPNAWKLAEWPAHLGNHMTDAWSDIQPGEVGKTGKQAAYKRLGIALRRMATEGQGKPNPDVMPSGHPNVKFARSPLVLSEVHRLVREFNHAALAG